MEQPTGEARPAAAPAKNRTPLFIGAGVIALVVIGAGLYLESPHDVGKLEKLQLDESDVGKLRARTLREIGSFEAELSSLPENTQRTVRPLLKTARQSAISASSVEDLEKARGDLQAVRSLVAGKGATAPAAGN